MTCPYDTNGDGDCAACSHPRVVCTGDGPAFGEEDSPFAAFTEGFTKIDNGTLTVSVGWWDGERWVYEHRIREDWHCEADAVGITTTHCSPDNPVHSAPCGWRS